MSSFDHIAQEILKQQQIMGELQAENRALQRQLADLRAGRGIFVEIGGKRFPLRGEIPVPYPTTTATVVQEDFPTPSTTSTLQEAPAPFIIESEEIEEVAPAAEIIPIDVASIEKEDDMKQEVPGFLEEMMMDEFAAAATSPMAVWTGPMNKQDQASIEEEQKAALRRELMGSFLLE